MLIGLPKESAARETRVALTPEVVKKLTQQGHEIVVATGAGVAAHFPDSAYLAAGARVGTQAQALGVACVVKIRSPNAEELAQLSKGAVLIGMLEPFNQAGIAALAAQGISAVALEAAPRISRAQSLDVLSSQANIAGYKAVMLAVHHYGRFMPMLMTAAGTVKAARVVILGVGVAGLQAIATAKRLGAVIEASDVRPATKEQVESLGAKFIDVAFETDEEREIAQGLGGYARPMPAAWIARQQIEIAKRIAQADIVITTALIPGRKAPTLVLAETVAAMKPGSVIVDMAAGKGEMDHTNGNSGAGGNCPLSRADQVITHQRVTIIGETNLPALLAADASSFYARNALDFLKLVLTKEGQLHLNTEDEIVAACLVCQDGVVRTK